MLFIVVCVCVCFMCFFAWASIDIMFLALHREARFPFMLIQVFVFCFSLERGCQFQEKRIAPTSTKMLEICFSPRRNYNFQQQFASRSSVAANSGNTKDRSKQFEYLGTLLLAEAKLQFSLKTCFSLERGCHSRTIKECGRRVVEPSF